VDLVPRKTCAFDCVFCQVGRTTDLSIERREHVPTGEVLAELRAWKEAGGTADFVTLAGSGEPTLHTRFAEVLRAAREGGGAKTALLSSGALMHLPEVREGAVTADVLKVSLSAWDQASFERINRPHPALRFDRVLDGLRGLGRDVRGELWVEVFVVAGVNSDLASMRRIARLARGIGPARVHLNTVVRPGAEPWAAAASKEALETLAAAFDPPAEVIAEWRPGRGTAAAGAAGAEGAVEAMLARRPCTAADVAASLGMTAGEAAACLAGLAARGRIREAAGGQAGVYYVSARPDGGEGGR
jgi:wyosine [tRNA(Phe)-imidazoG37] synthetase (radical SAM superfamily)